MQPDAPPGHPNLPGPPLQPTHENRWFPQGKDAGWGVGSDAAGLQWFGADRGCVQASRPWRDSPVRATPRLCQPFANLRFEPHASGFFSQLLHRQAEGQGHRRVGQAGGLGPGWVQVLPTLAPHCPDCTTFFLHKSS